ncbi:hypothetical protein KR074_009584 [Drosophila pseudoananassae]|nr:hypothetical protein KR074_009584 [Drosophila pseudoananassae]
MRKDKIQIVLLLLLLHVNLFEFSFGNKDDTTTTNQAPPTDYDDSDESFPEIGARDPPSTTPTTTTTTETPIYREQCGLNRNEYCVKLDECGSRSGKIIVELDRPEIVCHYLETCCKESEIKKSALSREVNLTNNQCDQCDQCGITNVDGLYMTVKSRSKETSFAEFPWVVAILDSASNHICNGVLISRTVVLSAAYCFPGNQTRIVRAGDWDLRTDNEIVPHENRLVKKTIVHKKFILSDLLNNLALAILESAFPRTKHIVPVCMPFDDRSTSMLNTTSCFAIGWNVISYAESPPERNIVFKMDVDTTMTSISKLDGSITSSVRLSTGLNFMGSPLVCPNNGNQYFVLGISSYTNLNEQEVFANVTSNLEWINENLI